MIKSVFTTQDVKDIIDSAFKEHTEQVTIKSGDVEQQVDLQEYLNIQFYTFSQNLGIYHNQEKRNEEFENWRSSLNMALNKSYAVVETTSEDSTISPDIDFVEKSGQITFIVQERKINQLDYYIQRLRSIYLGQPQKIKNNFGETLNLYLLIGTLQYDEEPSNTSYGKTIVCSVGFKVTYLTNALTYSDYDISLSFDNREYYHLPFNELSLQIIFANDSLPRYNKSDLAGVRNKTASFVASVSFYDFLKPIFQEINKRFMSFACNKLNGQDLPAQDINEIVYLKIKVNKGDESDNTDEYLFLCTYDSIQKKIENASYSSMSLTLKGSAVDVDIETNNARLLKSMPTRKTRI